MGDGKKRGATRPVLELHVGDELELRRRHPCGGYTWRVDRLGADIGLRCTTCARHILLERRVVESRLVRFISRGPAAAPSGGAAEPVESRGPSR